MDVTEVLAGGEETAGPSYKVPHIQVPPAMVHGGFVPHQKQLF